MRTRSWSIRSKIIALAAVPVTAMLALWAFATVLTAGPAMSLLSAQTLLDTVGSPGVDLVGEIQKERRLTAEFLSDPEADPALLANQRAATDRRSAEFRTAALSEDAQDAAGATLKSNIRQTVSGLDALAAARARIDTRETDADAAMAVFNNINDSAFRLFAATATFGDESIDREIRTLTSVARGQEYLSRADALLGAAYAGGKLTEQGRIDLLEAISTSRHLFTQGLAELPSRDQEAYRQVMNGSAVTRLTELEDELLASSRAGAAPPVPAEAWRQAFSSTTAQLLEFDNGVTGALAEVARPLAITVLGRLAGAGLIGLFAVIASIVISVRIGRSIVGRLVRLRGEALEMAGERLPKVIRRLQRGESVDVESETPLLEYGNDEIGQVGHAFNEVQHTAVHSAVEEANVRRGINEVFLNIARRSQTLLHRQLALLDKMERRETDSQELEDLYRVDHLATRMRRHAEDLVILAGAAPGRGWRNPVPVIDVVRGSISEVEDYKRIDIVSVESSAILGRAVGDLIHLLAELLENAASFSPPTTRVTVVGQILPNGYAIEIEDRGLGMSGEAITETNRKLVEPPDFDPADSARLGLFVVAQLSGRQGIRVSLRPSAYGGITAVVLVPGDLVTAGPSGPGGISVGKTAGKGGPSKSSLHPLGAPPASNGTGEHPVLAASEPERSLSGPTPSTVLADLSADGLVQRRRTVRRADLPLEPPAQLPPNLTDPAELTPPAGIPIPNGVHHGDGLDIDWPSGSDGPSLPAFDPRILTRGTGLIPPTPTTPVLPPRRTPDEEAAVTQVVPTTSPTPPAPPAPAEVPAEPSARERPADEALLPRRVRQASLAPQLRGPMAPREEAATPRSPEEVRSIMSSLQSGTNRGRRDAASLTGPATRKIPVSERPDAGSDSIAGVGDRQGPVTDKQQTTGQSTWSEAATVTFPAVDSSAGGAGDGTSGRPNQKQRIHRSEKDA